MTRNVRLAALSAPLILVLAACAGPAGATGPAGPAGPTGLAGAAGPAGLVATMTRELDVKLGEVKQIWEVTKGGKTFDEEVAEEHRWEPPVLVVFAGDKVRLTVSNPRGNEHSLAIPAFKVDTGPLAPRTGKATVEFTADKAGIYPFLCNSPFDEAKKVCDLDHKYQTGTLIVLAR